MGVNTERRAWGGSCAWAQWQEEGWRFMPKQTKTFQSFSSPLNISWSLQTFLWNHRQQSLLQGLPWRKEVSSLSSFCHIHPFPLKTSFFGMCSSEPKNLFETWHTLLLPELLSRLRLVLIFLIIFMAFYFHFYVSAWVHPTEVSFRQVKSHCPFFHFLCVCAILCYQ